MVSVLFAFAAAFTNALNVVTQHVASTAAPAKDRGWRLALYLIRNPLWLFGVAAMIGSFVFQALALYNGRLSVVQSVLVTELVFSLVIGSVWLHRHVVPAAWVSASVTAAGLAVFLVMAEPRGGHPQATAHAWLPALLTCGGLVALLGACSILPKAETPDAYRLPAKQQPARATPPVNWSLRVDAPKASQVLDSNRIAVLPNGDLLSDLPAFSIVQLRMPRIYFLLG